MLSRFRDRKGYITNIPGASAEFVIGAYHRLYEIERSFRMSKHDLAARPIYHRKRESIEAHLSIVFAALAVSRLVEDATGWSIKRFVRNRPPLPHRQDPCRRPPADRRRPTAGGAPRRAREDQATRQCALI